MSSSPSSLVFSLFVFIVIIQSFSLVPSSSGEDGVLKMGVVTDSRIVELLRLEELATGTDSTDNFLDVVKKTRRSILEEIRTDQTGEDSSLKKSSSGEDCSLLKAKQNERWTKEEHQKFVEAFKLYGPSWRRIEVYMGTKKAFQIRSHAQKSFSKVRHDGARYPAPAQPPQSNSGLPKWLWVIIWFLIGVAIIVFLCFMVYLIFKICLSCFGFTRASSPVCPTNDEL